jgi:putative SOS response-associated peptidase YedK
MCTNYEPYLDANFIRRFGAELPAVIFKREAYPGYEAPVILNIIRKGEDNAGEVECIAARFGLVPYWAKPEDAEKAKMPFGTHNARSETVGEKASFKHAWRNRQFCLIPAQSFYEPCWETGKAVRWKMSLTNGEPFALAGIWEKWQRDEKVIESFTMLTVNADDHEVMKHMHRPGDEKRMPVILIEDDYVRWLNATTEEAHQMCQTFSAERMVAIPAPLPPRAKAVTSA